MAALPQISLRMSLAKTSRDAADLLARAAELMQPNESIRQALHLGMQKLAFRAQKERFSGQGPFPASEHRLGVVSGRLRRDIHAEEPVITATGYSGRLGAAVEYFGAHEVGFSGTVQVPQHTRGAYQVNRKPATRTSKSGKQFSVRANQFTVLPASVRAHSRKLNIPARAPLRTAIEQDGPPIIGGEIRKVLKSL